MKAILFALFVALLMVGCGEEETELERTKRLAEEGGKVAQFNLGVIYDKGKGLPEDDKEAVKWFRRAAEQGHVMAMGNLGYMYYEGRGVPQDYINAFRFFLDAASHGNGPSQAMVGEMYASGKGAPKNWVHAYAWLNVAIASGFEEAKELLRDKLVLTPEELIDAQSLSTQIFQLIEAKKKDDGRQ